MLTAPVSPIGGEAVFAGFSSEVLYYVTFQDGTARTVWGLGPGAGQLQPLLSFRGRHDFDAYASVSPNGKFIAYTDVDSLHLFDIARGESRLLLRGDGAACDGTSIKGCFVYYGSKWSPDGAVLLVDKGLYEGSKPVLVDPFADEPGEIEARTTESLWGRAWSPDSASFCGTHSYGGTGLYVAVSEGWDMPNLLPEYVLPDPAKPLLAPRTERYIQSCDWLDSDTIAFATGAVEFPGDRPSVTLQSLEVSVHSPSHAATRTIAKIAVDDQLTAPYLHFIPNSQSVIVGYLHGPFGDYDSATPARPIIVNVKTGERTPTLAAGDRVVAVLPEGAPSPTPTGAPGSLKPPDSEFPAAGVCFGPGTSEVVTIELNIDIPTPRCARVSPGQRLRFKNTTPDSVGVRLAGYTLEIPPGEERQIEAAVGSLLAPGAHRITTSLYGGGGPEIVVVE